MLTVNKKQASYPLIDESLLHEIPGNAKVYSTSSFEPLRILSLLGRNSVPHGGFANPGRETIVQKLMKFIRGNFFIPDARVGWVRYALREAERIIERENIKDVLISSPPHSSQLIGLKLKKKFSIRWIADLRDPWTDIYYYPELLHTRFARRMDKNYEKQVMDLADDIIVVSSPIRDSYLSKSSHASPKKFHIIPNGFDEDDFQQNVVVRKSEFLITYVGTMAKSYNPQAFFDVLRRVKEETGQPIVFRVIGSLPDDIQKQIRDCNIKVEYTSYVSHDAAIRFMKESACLLLLIPDVPGAEGILTGKLFEYLASRRPVIAMGPPDGSAAAIINECEAGRVFDRVDTEMAAEYLKGILEQWKSNPEFLNPSKAYQKYSRRNLTKVLASLILNKTE